MKHIVLCVCLLLMSCKDELAEHKGVSIPIVSGAPSGNFPDKIAGLYTIDNATLNGPKFEVIVSADPESSVVYLPNSDITHLFRQIVFRGGGEVPYLSMCSEIQAAIEFKSNGKTSHTCLGSISNAMEMGFWNTTGSQDELLAWSIIHGSDLIECEIVPYEINSELLVGYLVFPLPKYGYKPFLEDGNWQYRKIRIVLKKS